MPAQSELTPNTPAPWSTHPTLGVELEFFLTEGEAFALSPRAAEVLAQLAAPAVFKAELFACMVELNSAIAAGVEPLRAELGAQLHALRQACAAHKLLPLGVGTHPTAHWEQVPISAQPRHQALSQAYGLPMRSLLIAGTHFHVGMRNERDMLYCYRGMQAFLPHFAALAAASPFCQGQDSLLDSYRIAQFAALPHAGLPPATLQYAAFKRQLALLRGKEGMANVWWDLRPHLTYRTLELRICDGMHTVWEICALAALYQCLTAYLQERQRRQQRPPMLPPILLAENKWRAIRHGLQAQLLDSKGKTRPLAADLQDWLERLWPFAQQLDCTVGLAHVQTLLEAGNCASRMRATYAKERSLTAVLTQLTQSFAQAMPPAAAGGCLS